MSPAISAPPPFGRIPAPLKLEPLRSDLVRGFGPWKDFVHDHFPWLEHRNHGCGDFRAEVSAYRFGDGALTTISAGASEVIRTRHLAEASEEGFIKLMWQMSGTLHLEQDGRQCDIEPGQVTVCDTARPYRIRLSDHARFAILMLPHTTCPGWEHISPKICGETMRDGSTMRAALGALLALSSLPAQQESGAATGFQAVQWMLRASLHRCAGALGCDAPRNPRLNKAQRHILEHIADPELDANALARALCMSRRSLYMLFRNHGLTPARMIHDLRLEQSLQALGDPQQQHRKITDIAFGHGFGDYATFSRLFKGRYGLTPSEYRLKARAPAGQPAGPMPT